MDMEETTEEGWSVAPPNTNTNTKTGSTAATHGHYGNMTMTFNTPSTHTNAFANSQNAGAHTQAFGRGALHFSDSDMKMGDSTDIGRAEPSFGAAHTAATRDKRGNMTMAFNNSSKTNTNNNITHNKIASTNSNLRTSAPVSQPQPQTQLVGLAIPNNSNSLHTNVNTVGAWEASSFDNGSTAATRDRRGNMTMTFNNKPTTIQGAQASRDTDRAHTATAAAFNTDGSDPTDGYTSAHAREVRDSTEDGRQQPTFGKAGTAATRDRRGNMTMTFNNNPAPTSTVTGEPAGDTGGAMADPENVPRAFHTDTSTAGKGGPRAFTQDTGNVGEEKRKASADSNHSNTAFGGQALGASLRSRLGPAPAPAPAPQGLGVGTDVSAEGESKKAGTSTMEKLIQMNDGKRLDADDLRSQRFNASDQTVTEWKKILEKRNDDLRAKQGRRIGVIVPACEDMCPELERYSREVNLELDPFEREPNTVRNNGSAVCDHHKAIKKFRRSAPTEHEFLPNEIRTPAALEKTLDYIASVILDDKTISLSTSFQFVNDRFRAIRVDMSQQILEDTRAMRIYENIVRFHLHGSAVLSGSGNFEFKHNWDEMRKALMSLTAAYDNYRGLHSNNTCVSRYEPQMQSVLILLSIIDWSTGKMLSAFDTNTMPQFVRFTTEVELAIRISCAVRNYDYYGFFRLCGEADYITLCALHPIIDHVRSLGLKVIHGSFGDGKIPLADLVRTMKFNSQVDAQAFVENHGLSVHAETVARNEGGVVVQEDVLSVYLKEGGTGKGHKISFKSDGQVPLKPMDLVTNKLSKYDHAPYNAHTHVSNAVTDGQVPDIPDTTPIMNSFTDMDEVATQHRQAVSRRADQFPRSTESARRSLPAAFGNSGTKLDIPTTETGASQPKPAVGSAFGGRVENSGNRETGARVSAFGAVHDTPAVSGATAFGTPFKQDASANASAFGAHAFSDTKQLGNTACPFGSNVEINATGLTSTGPTATAPTAFGTGSGGAFSQTAFGAGSTATTQPLTTAFGSNTGTNAFGADIKHEPKAFGSNTGTNAFGTDIKPEPKAFCSNTGTNAFGADIKPEPKAFGSNTGTNAFGSDGDRNTGAFAFATAPPALNNTANTTTVTETAAQLCTAAVECVASPLVEQLVQWAVQKEARVQLEREARAKAVEMMYVKTISQEVLDAMVEHQVAQIANDELNQRISQEKQKADNRRADEVASKVGEELVSSVVEQEAQQIAGKVYQEMISTIKVSTDMAHTFIDLESVTLVRDIGTRLIAEGIARHKRDETLRRVVGIWKGKVEERRRWERSIASLDSVLQKRHIARVHHGQLEQAYAGRRRLPITQANPSTYSSELVSAPRRRHQTPSEHPQYTHSQHLLRQKTRRMPQCARRRRRSTVSSTPSAARGILSTELTTREKRKQMAVCALEDAMGRAQCDAAWAVSLLVRETLQDHFVRPLRTVLSNLKGAGAYRMPYDTLVDLLAQAVALYNNAIDGIDVAAAVHTSAVCPQTRSKRNRTTTNTHTLAGVCTDSECHLRTRLDRKACETALHSMRLPEVKQGRCGPAPADDGQDRCGYDALLDCLGQYAMQPRQSPAHTVLACTLQRHVSSLTVAASGETRAYGPQQVDMTEVLAGVFSAAMSEGLARVYTELTRSSGGRDGGGGVRTQMHTDTRTQDQRRTSSSTGTKFGTKSAPPTALSRAADELTRSLTQLVTTAKQRAYDDYVDQDTTEQTRVNEPYAETQALEGDVAEQAPQVQYTHHSLDAAMAEFSRDNAEAKKYLGSLDAMFPEALLTAEDSSILPDGLFGVEADTLTQPMAPAPEIGAGAMEEDTRGQGLEGSCAGLPIGLDEMVANFDRDDIEARKYLENLDAMFPEVSHWGGSQSSSPDSQCISAC